MLTLPERFDLANNLILPEVDFLLEQQFSKA